MASDSNVQSSTETSNRDIFVSEIEQDGQFGCRIIRWINITGLAAMLGIIVQCCRVIRITSLIILSAMRVKQLHTHSM